MGGSVLAALLIISMESGEATRRCTTPAPRIASSLEIFYSNKNNYSYQYQQTSTGLNGNSVHSNGNGKVPYAELENGHAENYRRHHSNKMGVEYQGLLSPEETDSLLMERTMEVRYIST